MAVILVVEDEKSIRKMISMHLNLVGHIAIEAENTTIAKNILDENNIDVVLLDVMLPGEDGFSFSDYILKKDIPFLFLTAKTDVSDRVLGLNLGAEDYILKPFEPAELLARIDVVLRHAGRINQIYTDKYLTIDFNARTVICNNEKIELTSTEYELLSILVRNKSMALTRESLLKTVWGYEYIGETRTVDVHMQRLRKKLCADMIETVYKFGYKYVGSESSCRKD